MLNVTKEIEKKLEIIYRALNPLASKAGALGGSGQRTANSVWVSVALPPDPAELATGEREDSVCMGLFCTGALTSSRGASLSPDSAGAVWCRVLELDEDPREVASGTTERALLLSCGPRYQQCRPSARLMR